ncbi:OLC1v1007422C1 [Oldenlandia corymbosa var. corymbosa]|uniref:OLC1v1007422C1 n=1 Tax=Oldenlandia corymbosa var. corymbosa TaxID=529605 RepID=A0AAV1DMK7_OLDCO|nr:OLC1v1007422C1 [Oldenlandia corymbosa var. corymbosa]
MLQTLNQRLKRLCLKLGLSPAHHRRPKQKVVIKKLEKSNTRTRYHQNEAKEVSPSSSSSAVIHPSTEFNNNNNNNNGGSASEKPIRVATFNAALFSMAPAVPKTMLHHQNNNSSSSTSSSFDFDDNEADNFNFSSPRRIDLRTKSMSIDRVPKSILKQSPLHSSSMREEPLTKQQKFARSKLRVSINLPDNEISLRRSGASKSGDDDKENRAVKGKGPIKSTMSMPNYQSHGNVHGVVEGQSCYRSTKTVLEVLMELNADVLALQDVKAEEEKGMKPLSDLAEALGMNYVFAESWAPEYGNAILSRWPIKKWKSQKIFDDTDFRNVLKATIDVPEVGEFEFYCTHLDHLDENWRMKQINAIIQSTDTPHILAGGINSLEETDYSSERWTDIVKYYEEIGKPIPKAEVMKYLKSKQYTDAKDFAGECESVVMIAKGQSVQGTCKYGTRVDYILSSPNSPYKFVPGSYSVFSSKGTSDHHIVKVDVIKVVNTIPADENQAYLHNKKGRHSSSKRLVKITHNSSPAKGIWKSTQSEPIW